MKLEKEVYIGNVYETTYIDGKYNLSFNCIFHKCLNATDKSIFDKIQNSKKIKLTLEVEEPILDEEERKYLSGVIRPFRDRIKYIRKSRIYGQEYINVVYNSKFKDDTNFCLPLFKKGSMYKGMELNKEYTLEDLGL